jgi:hypothetical protein
VRNNQQIQPHWHSVARRFPAARDCLASFLAFESAEILAGAKPANLINLVNRPHHCGRNFYQLWKECGDALLGHCGLIGRVLVDRGASLLLLVYTPSLLDALLQSPATQAMLHRAGYAQAGETAAVLAELEERCRAGEGFPHEIGIFLGYPLKDVAAFLGWVAIPFTVQGPWKIYGRPEQSLALAECHRSCRGQMLQRLARCTTPVECLQPSGSRRPLFLFGN